MLLVHLVAGVDEGNFVVELGNPERIRKYEHWASTIHTVPVGSQSYFFFSLAYDREIISEVSVKKVAVA